MTTKEGMAVVIGMGGNPQGDEIEFMAPEGFDYSEMTEGDEKEILAKVRYDGDGGFTLVSVDGYPLSAMAQEEEEMPEGFEEEEEMTPDEEPPFSDRLRQRAGLM